MNWKKKIERLMHLRVKWQMMLVFIAVTVIPILIIGAVSVRTLRTQMKISYETRLESESDRIKAILFDTTSSVYSYCEPIVSTQTYRNVLAAEAFTGEVRTRYDDLVFTMDSLQQKLAAVSSIGIYTDNPAVPNGSHIFCAESFDDYEWYHKTGPDEWNHWTWTTVQVNRTQQDEELTLVRRINIGSSKYRAYLVITVSSNHLRNRILPTDNFVMSSVGDSNCIFSSDYKAEEKVMPLMENLSENHYNYLGPCEIDGKKLLTRTSFFLGYLTTDRFYILVSDPTAYAQMNYFTGMLILVILFAFAGLSVIILLFTRSFSRRVVTLRMAMHRASLGDYNIVDDFHGADELAETFEDLKTMVEMVREKEAQYYRSKLEEQRLLNMQKEMEFKMLSSQINPHFLYNTLEMIRMQAISQNNKTVADSIMLLARSMQYVLENTGTDDSTLEKEFNHVKTYLQIQRMRFGDRINWDFYLDEDIDLKRYHILPLLIQPVVENTIVHGLEGISKNGHVSIILEKENEERLVITVRDNGVGIEEERLVQIQENLNKKKNGIASIGLYNINQRIKVRYGEPYGVQIRSGRLKGTSVSLTLPAKYADEENGDEQID